jgi:radical SAM protein with 4Fe4S-binding SPASM domain
MNDDVVEALLCRLKEIGFRGLVSMFNNNEPLLDDRLPDIIARFKRALPLTRIEIYTNGLLLDLEAASRLWRSGLDSLVVEYFLGNRSQNRKVREFLWEYRGSPFYRTRNVTIKKIDPRIVRSNRCGNAPNKPGEIEPLSAFCPLPFTQFNVNYSGDVHLCCNDVYYEEILGNVKTDSIEKIWRSSKYQFYREHLLSCDRTEGICSRCDNRVLMGGVNKITVLDDNGQLFMPEYISNGVKFPFAAAGATWHV